MTLAELSDLFPVSPQAGRSGKGGSAATTPPRSEIAGAIVAEESASRGLGDTPLPGFVRRTQGGRAVLDFSVLSGRACGGALAHKASARESEASTDVSRQQHR